MQGGAGYVHHCPANQLPRSPFLATSPYPPTPEVSEADREVVRPEVQVDGAASLSRNTGYGNRFGMA